MQKVFLRTEFNYDTDVVSKETSLVCSDISLTRQSDAEQADINYIVRVFGVTGELPVSVRAPQYGDFTGINDFHSAVNVIAQANESFDAMPADVRAKFHNSTAEFIDFVNDEANRAEAEKLGLVFPKPEVIPDKVVDIQPTI
jgi:phage internal scaffolding protein